MASGYAYVATGTRYLAVIDASSPGDPVLLAAVEDDAVVDGVGLDPPRLAVVQAGSLQWLDVEVPDAPIFDGFVGHDEIWESSRVVIEGDDAYVTTSAEALLVVDLNEDPNPRIKIEISLPSNGSAVAVDAVAAYVALADGGLAVVDLDVACVVGETETSGAAFGVARASDSHVVVAVGGLGIDLVDVADATEPVQVHSVGELGIAVAVAVEDDVAYVADTEGGGRLHAVGVGSPEAPDPIGSVHLDPEGEPRDPALADGHAYVTGSTYLWIVDLDCIGR